MPNNVRHLTAASVLVLLATVPTFLILRAIYALPPAASAEAGPIDSLFQGHFWLIAFLFSLVTVFMLYSIVAFRRRPDDESDGELFYGNTFLEIGWTALPIVAVLVFGLWGQQALNTISQSNDNEMTIEIVGFQWRWDFIYPEQQGLKVTDQMVVPVNRPLRLVMTSEGNAPGESGVNHAFWVPEFRVKRDLIPGKVHILRVTPTELGDYKLRCAELCGAGHANMLASVSVVTQAEFEEWVGRSSALPEDPVERGQLWAVQFGCAGCHSVDGTRLVGPTWLGLFGSQREFTDGTTAVADQDYLRNSIVNANARIVAGYEAGVMPQVYGQQLSPPQIDDILAYIISLSE